MIEYEVLGNVFKEIIVDLLGHTKPNVLQD